MKKVIAVLFAGTLSALAVEAPITVPPIARVVDRVQVRTEVAVAKVRVRTIIIGFNDAHEASVRVAWEWLDADGKVLKRGVRTFTEAELAPMLSSVGSDLAQLKGLFAAIAKADAESPAPE